MKMYEITSDLAAIDELFNSAVDENGEPRPLTPEEEEFLKNELTCSSEQFAGKFDSYCGYMADLKRQSEEADGKRKSWKSEIDRLSARSKAFLNRRDSMKNYLFFNMKSLGIEKYKTSLFSAGVQATPLSVTNNGKLKNIPEEFLKPRELNTTAIKDAIKDGSIKVIDGDLYFNGEQLDGVRAEKGETLVIR